MSECAILTWDALFRRLFAATDRAQKRCGGEWRVKIHRDTLAHVRTLATTQPVQPRAARAVEVMNAYMVSIANVGQSGCSHEPLTREVLA